jgi:hypothetical protein
MPDDNRRHLLLVGESNSKDMSGLDLEEVLSGLVEKIAVRECSILQCQMIIEGSSCSLENQTARICLGLIWRRSFLD